MKVKNINGTSEPPCACGSWLGHWKAHSRLTLTFCPVDGCVDLCDVGAHVQKDDPLDTTWYVVPMCRRHNAHVGAALPIAYWVRLVPVDTAEPCDTRLARALTRH